MDGKLRKPDEEQFIEFTIFFNGVTIDIPKDIFKTLVQELNHTAKMLELYENVKK